MPQQQPTAVSIFAASMITGLMLTLAACGGQGAADACQATPSSCQPAVVILQPVGLMVTAGQQVVLSVDAAGTEPLSYQWRKDGQALSGATRSALEFNPVALVHQGQYDVIVANDVGRTTSQAAALTVSPVPAGFRPVATSYVDFDNAPLNLFAWEGSHIAVLSRRSDLLVPDMAAIVRALDQAYLYYRDATGYTPSSAKTYLGKLTIADVPTTCGAGCGYLGATGIELLNTTFDVLLDRVHGGNQFDQAVFYEFGRNFWSLAAPLDYKAPDRGDSIVTGFAVFMRFMAMEAAGVQGAPFNAWPFDEFKSRVQAMVDLYQADPSQNWANTLKVGSAQANNPSNLGATDLFASMLFRLHRDQGGNAFIARLWKEAAKRPAATTTQAAVDNFFLAACAAANKDLSSLFSVAWRWPISAAARAGAAAYPAT